MKKESKCATCAIPSALHHKIKLLAAKSGEKMYSVMASLIELGLKKQAEIERSKE